MKTRTVSISEIGIKMVWTAALWVAAALMTAGAVRADIYSWKDADGVIHFSNQDAPARASIYMKEPVPGPADAVIREPQPNIQIEREIEAVRRQVRTEAKLEEANRRLDQALEKVDELTDKVADSQARATAAAEAAQQAAIVAEREAQAAGYNSGSVNERVVVYSSPYYPYRNKKYGHGYRGPNYRGYLKDRNPNSHKNRYERHKQKLHSDRYKFNRYDRHKYNRHDKHKFKRHDRHKFNRNNGHKFHRNRHYR